MITKDQKYRQLTQGLQLNRKTVSLDDFVSKRYEYRRNQRTTTPVNIKIYQPGVLL